MVRPLVRQARDLLLDRGTDRLRIAALAAENGGRALRNDRIVGIKIPSDQAFLVKRGIQRGIVAAQDAHGQFAEQAAA